MTFNDLFNELYKNKSDNISIKRNQAKLGNKGGQGNYEIIELEIDGKKYTLSNQSGEWIVN